MLFANEHFLLVSAFVMAHFMYIFFNEIRMPLYVLISEPAAVSNWWIYVQPGSAFFFFPASILLPQ